MSSPQLPSQPVVNDATPLTITNAPHIEEKSNIESDAKQSIHSKPGSLADKFRALSSATERALAPAIHKLEEVTHKVVQKMPENITHAEADSKKVAEHREKQKAEEALAARELGALPNPTPQDEARTQPSFTSALKDFGQHIGESVVHTSKEAAAAAKHKYEEMKGSHAASSTTTTTTEAGGASTKLNNTTPLNSTMNPSPVPLANTSASNSASNLSGTAALGSVSGSNASLVDVPSSGYSTLSDPAAVSLDAQRGIAQQSTSEKEKAVNDIKSQQEGQRL